MWFFFFKFYFFLFLVFTHHLRTSETKTSVPLELDAICQLLIPSTSYVQVRNYTRVYNILTDFFFFFFKYKEKFKFSKNIHKSFQAFFLFSKKLINFFFFSLHRVNQSIIQPMINNFFFVLIFSFMEA